MDLPAWLLESLKSLGIAGGPVMFFFWYIEYRQRREWQKDLLERNEKFINAGNAMANALTGVSTAVAGAQETLRVQSGLMTEIAVTMRALVRRGVK